MPNVHGHHDPRFDRVHESLASSIESGVEVGASIAVDLDGERVVDLWGGWRDQERTTPWTSDTLVNLWSTTKTITSLAVLCLVDRGEIDVHAPVARYWPEFAQNGKSSIEVRHLLGHTSGVSAWEQPFTNTDCYDLEASTAKLATQRPWWEPGTAAGYHASNYGHLNGELVRRVTGLTLGDFVAQEMAGPMGADLYIGLPDSEFGRVARMYPPIVNDMAASLPADSLADAPATEPSIAAKTLAGSMADIEQANTDDWRRAQIGAANGHGNARSVAQVLSAISLGGSASGVRLLSPRTIDLIFEEQFEGIDLFLGIPLRWGIGYALKPSGGVPFIRGQRACFWGGWGGSMIVMHPEERLTISYVMNQMQPGTIGSDVAAAYFDQIYACLGID